ncbi:pectinesterase inhibitor domain-containing protein [Artemisia annua]|uniref:Pectinesterase inhibitor domain-containing protein n=1 Tax=Artemisia annua TaxID=35608 RepID=A0A2U1LQ63_ARTAN|nr:pectinesterase inhibitor domain-containing protein [Artemisia annua]
MDRFLFYLVLLLITVKYTTSTGTNTTSLEFVKISCNTTLYPSLCVESLSSYAVSIKDNDQKLAKVALVISLKAAKSMAAYVSTLIETSNIESREYQALKDCDSSMASCVTSLTESLQEIRKMAQFTGQDFIWHMSNVQTWVSSALTNQDTCTDGFSDGSMNGQLKDDLSKKMNTVSQLTSNALALVNGFAKRHKEVTHT